MTAEEQTAQKIRAHLAPLHPLQLDIRDDSRHHAGHAGAAGGGGHYHLTIVAEAFRNLAPLARHRLVHAALGPLLHGEIHALQIDARAP